MILAAGLGTRLKPFTDHHPKALAVVNQKTLLQRNIEYLAQFGITEFIVNVHHFADQIEAHLKHERYSQFHIAISDERDTVLETGGGLKKAAWFFNDGQPFVLMNADILTNLNLTNLIQQQKTEQAVAMLAVSKRESSRYFLFNRSMQLCGWRNLKTAEERWSISDAETTAYAFSGLHIIDPSLFTLMHQEGKFSMVDVYLELAKTQKIMGYDHSGSILLDVGKPDSLLQAETLFR